MNVPRHHKHNFKGTAKKDPPGESLVSSSSSTKNTEAKKREDPPPETKNGVTTTTTTTTTFHQATPPRKTSTGRPSATIVSPFTLTPEQHARMEHNRAVALERRRRILLTTTQQKEKEKASTENPKLAADKTNTEKKENTVPQEESPSSKKISFQTPPSSPSPPTKSTSSPHKRPNVDVVNMVSPPPALSSSPSARKKAKLSHEIFSSPSPARSTGSKTLLDSWLVTSPPKTLSSATMECTECHSKVPDSLCFKWKHSPGEIQRVHIPPTNGGSNPSSATAAAQKEETQEAEPFRYQCCDRLEGQPCEVRRHIVRRADGSLAFPSPNRVIYCHCRKPAHLQCTKTTGGKHNNLGRYYFSCGYKNKNYGSSSSSSHRACSFFGWADKLLDLPPQKQACSPDGIQEWIYLHANPFHESDLGSPLTNQNNQAPSSWNVRNTAVCTRSEAVLARKRLLASLIVRKLMEYVSPAPASGHDTTTKQSLEGLGRFSKTIVSIWNQGWDRILSHLSPLTEEQVMSRFFGSAALQNDDDDSSVMPSSSSLGETSQTEVLDVLQEAYFTNIVLRNTIVIDHTKGLIDLEGLENYLAVHSV